MVQRTPWTAADYERAADAYLASLPLEHFMESIPHSTQREITLGSLRGLTVYRKDVQIFNELLVQYFLDGKLCQVVPDNMVRLGTDQPKTTGSFNVELETDRPLLVLEYISPSSKEKDYRASFRKYESELKVPYCLMYYPEQQDLQFWNHTGKRYQRAEANAEGRYPIPELDLEVGIHEGWVRYWYRGKLLPLIGELLRKQNKVIRERNKANRERDRANKERDKANKERDKANKDRDMSNAERDAAVAEAARLRALLEQATNPSKKKNGS